MWRPCTVMMVPDPSREDSETSPLTTFRSTLLVQKGKRKPYHILLGTPITYHLPPKWTENEEVLCLGNSTTKLPHPT